MVSMIDMEPELSLEATDSGEEGWHRGFEQLRNETFADWRFEYDSRSDAFLMRRQGATSLTVGYFHPDHPDVILHLEVDTGTLAGVDIEGFKRSLKENPDLKAAYASLSLVHRLLRVPVIRSLMRLAEPKARAEVGHTVALRVCAS